MSNDELERRITAVEREIIALREQVTDTHTLAAHADRDVADFRTELRAQTRLIGALHETQVEQGRVLNSHGDAIESLRRDHGEKLDRIVTLLTGLIERGDES